MGKVSSRTWIWGSVCLVALLFILSGFAWAAYPKITPYVNDLANLLTSSEETQLDAYAARIETESTVEIAIVTVQDTGGENRILYANHIGDESGVGKAATDNGVIILWSLANEKGGAIAVGSGIEGTLNDAKVARIGRASRKHFDSGDYYTGFKTILEGIEKEVSPDSASSAETVEYTQDFVDEEISALEIFVLILIIIVVLVVVAALLVPSSGGGGGFIAGGIIGSGGGGFSTSSFGGGGFSGGGGSF